jgi:selenocysteine lyase/cysteine desulfurase
MSASPAPLLRSILEAAWRLVRVGYVRGLLVADALLFCVLTVDIFRLRANGYSVLALLSTWRVAPLKAAPLQAAAVLLVGLPAGLAAFRILLGGRSRIHSNLARELGRFGVASHVLSVALVSLAIALLPSAYLLTGFRYSAGRFEHAFVPWGAYIATLAGHYSALVASFVISVVGPTILVYVTRETKKSQYLSDLAERLELVDLSGDLYPVSYSPKRPNFIAGAVSPGIASVAAQAADYIAEYRALSPGSGRALRYLLQKASICDELIRQYLIPERARAAQITIGFATSTTRALEISLLESGARSVVISPFEHPAEVAAVKWMARTYDISVFVCAARPTLFQKSAAAAVEDLSLSIAVGIETARTATTKSGRIALVLSDVCWATGARTDISRVMADIEKALGRDNSDLYVIVDGAHAVGNGAFVRHLDVADAYIFSAHKWLFSGEPLGVVLSRRPFGVPPAVDLWNAAPVGAPSVRVGTVGPTAICHFAATLELLTRRGLDALWRRSTVFRSRILANVTDRFTALAVADIERYDSLAESFIVSLMPNGAFRWSESDVDAIQRIFTDSGLAVNVLKIHDGLEPVVRVTIPFYLSFRDADRLVAVLRSAVIARV